MKINIYLREKFQISRNEAERLLKAGKIKVNGKIVKGSTELTGKEKIEIIKNISKKEYFAYNKPYGLLTQGTKEEKSVVTLFKKHDLFPIGRLDKDSEGLMILTNDGTITSKILETESKKEKEYEIETDKPIPKKAETIFRRGMESRELGKLKPAKVKITADKRARISIVEGKKHQIRIMFLEMGAKVIKLKRVRIASVELGALKPGQKRPLTKKELTSLISIDPQ